MICQTCFRLFSSSAPKVANKERGEKIDVALRIHTSEKSMYVLLVCNSGNPPQILHTHK